MCIAICPNAISINSDVQWLISLICFAGYCPIGGIGLRVTCLEQAQLVSLRGATSMFAHQTSEATPNTPIVSVDADYNQDAYYLLRNWRNRYISPTPETVSGLCSTEATFPIRCEGRMCHQGGPAQWRSQQVYECQRLAAHLQTAHVAPVCPPLCTVLRETTVYPNIDVQ